MRSSIGVGLIGMGVVGSGVARVITENSTALHSHVGLPLKLMKVAVRDTSKQREFMGAQNILGDNPEELINDESVIVPTTSSQSTASPYASSNKLFAK